MKKHGMSSKELYLALFCDGVEPVCACGCGQPTTFDTITKGYPNKWIHGHVSRVKNNYGHNVAAQKKSQAKRRQMWKNGELTPWCKGLSKETDERVAGISRKNSEAVYAKEGEIERRSMRLRQHRLDGTVRTLHGAEHSQWKGGSSALQPLVRSHLYAVWTYPKLCAAGFRCQRCDAPSSATLEVHHDGERFAAILQEAIRVLGEADDDFAKKAAIAEWVARYHVENDVTGIVLCVSCHDASHVSERSA